MSLTWDVAYAIRQVTEARLAYESVTAPIDATPEGRALCKAIGALMWAACGEGMHFDSPGEALEYMGLDYADPHDDRHGMYSPPG